MGFQRPWIGVGIAGTPHLTAPVEGEDACFPAAQRVLGAGRRVHTQLHRIASPVPLDVIGFDVGNHMVISDLDFHPEVLPVMSQSELAAAV